MSRRFHLVFWGITLLWILLDQASKEFFLVLLQKRESIPVFTGLFQFNLTFNSGAAFSMLSGARWVFVVVSGLAALFIPLYLRTLYRGGERHWGYPVGMGLILGGALGNVIDRIFRPGGLVVDFLHFYWQTPVPEKSFPVFNLADSGITCGLILVLLLTFFSQFSSHPEQENSGDKGASEHVADTVQDR
jgi:signal peptidase II